MSTARERSSERPAQGNGWRGRRRGWRLAIAGLGLLTAVGLSPIEPALVAEAAPAPEPAATVAQQQGESPPVDAQQLLRMLQDLNRQMQQVNPQLTQQFVQANPPLQQLLQLNPDQADAQQIVDLLRQLDPDLQQLDAPQVLLLMQRQLELQQLLLPLSPQQLQQLAQRVPAVDPQTLEDLSPDELIQRLPQLIQQVRQQLQQMGVQPAPPTSAQAPPPQPATGAQVPSPRPAPGAQAAPPQPAPQARAAPPRSTPPSLGPSADASGLLVMIDTPNGGNTSTQLEVRGWAAAPGAPGGTGVDGVEVYLDGERDGGGVLLGQATYGLRRPDVAANLGSQQFLLSGYALLATVAPGPHTVYVYAHPSNQPADQGWAAPKQAAVQAVGGASAALAAAGLGSGGVLPLSSLSGSVVYALPGVGADYLPGPADIGGSIYAPTYYGYGLYGYAGSSVAYVYPSYYTRRYRHHHFR